MAPEGTIYMYDSMCVCMYICMCVCVCVYVCMYVFMCVCMCVCMIVCMYVCMYVFMCVCMYRIAGNFREVQIFAIFATHDQNAKIRTAKYEPGKFEHVNF